MVNPLLRILPTPDFVLSLPRPVKKAIVIFTDVWLCFFVTWFAFVLRLGEIFRFDWSHFWSASISVGTAIPVFLYFGLYQSVFRFTGLAVVRTIALAMLIYGLIVLTIFTIIGIESVPRTVGIIQPMLLFLGVIVSRGLAAVWLDSSGRLNKSAEDEKNALIYGAGAGGRQLLKVLTLEKKVRVLGFLDDDTRLIGQNIDMVPVHSFSHLDALISDKDVSQVFLAIPSLSNIRRQGILDKLAVKPIEVRVLPSLAELADGRVTVNDVREIDIEDLLGRSSVEPDKDLLCRNVTHKTVMVTGAGGWIGYELSRQIAALSPQRLLLVDISEYGLYSISEKLISQLSEPSDLNPVQIIPLLGSVCDSVRISQIMSAWSVDTIYHAAAYKHVPIVEHNPVEAIRNNVLGTLILAEAAIEHRVSDFVLISSDKAVRPTNVMGATKRLAELVLQSIQDQRSYYTTFSMVRFGNVLGSSGSVIPKFRSQIKSGGPLTITHPEITRYFMTTDEAAQLVIQAGALAEGGEVFVLDMGPSVKIFDLAKQMIKLSGKTERTTENPCGDILITFTGLRPGEKLYEELLVGDDVLGTSHPKISRAHEPFIQWSELSAQLKDLHQAVETADSYNSLRILDSLVEDFKASSHIFDWIARRNQLNKASD